jgi:hypothetical protein
MKSIFLSVYIRNLELQPLSLRLRTGAHKGCKHNIPYQKHVVSILNPIFYHAEFENLIYNGSKQLQAQLTSPLKIIYFYFFLYCLISLIKEQGAGSDSALAHRCFSPVNLSFLYKCVIKYCFQIGHPII